MPRNSHSVLLALLFSACIIPGGVFGDNAASATVTYSINSVCALSISGNPTTILVSSMIAGSTPCSTQESTTTYALTVNGNDLKITGYIGAQLPNGLYLSLNLQAPTGATSAGEVSLVTTPKDLVTGISNVSEDNLGIIYYLYCFPTAVPASNQTVDVIYTIQ